MAEAEFQAKSFAHIRREHIQRTMPHLPQKNPGSFILSCSIAK
jgi:hypothetical protein